MKKLNHHPIYHAGLSRLWHPGLNTKVIGRSAIKILRFMRPVRIDYLELGRIVYSRGEPKVPCHPAHLRISVLDEATKCWKEIKAVDLPKDPRIEGADFTPEQSNEELDAVLDPLLQEDPIRIELGGVETDHIRVECDREHPVWPNAMEMNGPCHEVPFGTLIPLEAFGHPLTEDITVWPHKPLLKQGSWTPEAQKGMSLRDLPHMLYFESKRFSIGFSPFRPEVVHLGWDALGKGQAANSRILFSQNVLLDVSPFERCIGLSGPFLRTLQMDAECGQWTGQVEAEGNCVRYTHLHVEPGLTVDAEFEVHAGGFDLRLTQRSDRPRHTLGFEAWRFTLNQRAGITGVFGEPTQATGRSGDVTLPLVLAADGVGGLSCRQVEGGPVNVQVESYRSQGVVTAGFNLCERRDMGRSLHCPAGTVSAAFSFTVDAIKPKRQSGSGALTEGIRRHWGTTFAGFRPEYRGFSIGAVSTNVHSGIGSWIDLISMTQKPKYGPDPIQMARHSVGMALLDGGGYGYFREHYADADPKLISSAGRLHQCRPSQSWLREIAPGLRLATQRMLEMMDPDLGVMLCTLLTGNSGSEKWSPHELDTVSSGYIDGISNAWAYRAFRNVAVLWQELGDEALSAACHDQAELLQQNISKHLLNPETGWFAGWRSQDGELHDAAYLNVNGPLLAFGLLGDAEARRALTGLETLRKEVGLAKAHMGLPFNLLPIPRADHCLPRLLGRSRPTFEVYTDGALSGWSAMYYLRALDIYGFKDEARKMALELDEGYALGYFNGPDKSGMEWRTWDNRPTGYEGTQASNFSVLYSIAVTLGYINPPQPEWWGEPTTGGTS